MWLSGDGVVLSPGRCRTRADCVRRECGRGLVRTSGVCEDGAGEGEAWAQCVARSRPERS